MDLISGGTQLDYSASASNNEAISYTATNNSTAYLYVYGYSGAVNNYQLSIESGLSPTANRSESVSAIINDHLDWSGYLFGLTSGTSYSIEIGLLAHDFETP